jgi:hypothetical protein
MIYYDTLHTYIAGQYSGVSIGIHQTTPDKIKISVANIADALKVCYHYRLSKAVNICENSKNEFIVFVQKIDLKHK